IQEIEHCTYILSEKNAGRTATRNALAQCAQYNRLLFMDADVLPKNDDFIKKFDIKNLKADLIFGGITYEENPPEKGQILRWKYGKAREDNPVSERNKNPYFFVISGALLIDKKIFLQANSYLGNVYGADILFILNLEKLNAEVMHIDNPVVHLGLESNSSFIEKTKRGLETLVMFESEGKVSDNYRSIQKAYLKLKKYRLIRLFIFTGKLLHALIETNLKSANPSLLLFDVYRLSFFARLKNLSEYEQ